jgi:hypothetical protein
MEYGRRATQKKSSTFNFKPRQFVNVYEQMWKKIQLLSLSTPVPSIWFEVNSI